jgi:hypothetical protein
MSLFTCRQVSQLALRTLRRSSSSGRYCCYSSHSFVDSDAAARNSGRHSRRGRLCVPTTAASSAAQLPRSPLTRQRWVWNASYMDEEQARDVERRIRDQIRSLDRIQEEIDATKSSTHRNELERLESERHQRESQLCQLLAQYKRVSGEEYHADSAVTGSRNRTSEKP